MPDKHKNPTIQTRVIVVPMIKNRHGQYLLCKKPANRGVFPGQWGLIGGGIESGETMEQALRRETREEVGLEVSHIEPLFFADGSFPKHYPDGSQQQIYMIFLVFACRAESEEVVLNDEFEQFAWVDWRDLIRYDLNPRTRASFHALGLL